MAEIYINGRVYHTMDTGHSSVKEDTANPVPEFDEEDATEQVPALPRGKQKHAKKSKAMVKPAEVDEDPEFMDAEEEFSPHQAPKKKSNAMLLMIPVIVLLAIIICVVFIVLPKIKAKKDAANNVLNQPAVETSTDEEWDWSEEDTSTTGEEEELDWSEEDTSATGEEEEWVWDEE